MRVDRDDLHRARRSADRRVVGRHGSGHRRDANRVDRLSGRVQPETREIVGGVEVGERVGARRRPASAPPSRGRRRPRRAAPAASARPRRSSVGATASASGPYRAQTSCGSPPTTGTDGRRARPHRRADRAPGSRRARGRSRAARPIDASSASAPATSAASGPDPGGSSRTAGSPVRPGPTSTMRRAHDARAPAPHAPRGSRRRSRTVALSKPSRRLDPPVSTTPAHVTGRCSRTARRSAAHGYLQQTGVPDPIRPPSEQGSWTSGRCARHVSNARVGAPRDGDARRASPHVVPRLLHAPRRRGLLGRRLQAEVDDRARPAREHPRQPERRRSSSTTTTTRTGTGCGGCASTEPRAVIESGVEHTTAIQLLRTKYPQYSLRRPTGPVIAIVVRRWTGWSASNATARESSLVRQPGAASRRRRTSVRRAAPSSTLLRTAPSSVETLVTTSAVSGAATTFSTAIRAASRPRCTPS